MTDAPYKVESGTTSHLMTTCYVLLDIRTLPPGIRKLAVQARQHRVKCATCTKYLYKHYNTQYGHKHCWFNLERHLIAKHGYDPRPWYIRMFWWTHPVIPGSTQ